MADIIALGELLIDLTQTGTDADGCGKFTAFPGGAPANVAVAASRLGASSGFIGKVGEDHFGDLLAQTLVKEGVDTSGLYRSSDVNTTLAIVSVDGSGERGFSFYRNPGADTQLTAEEAVSAIERAPGQLKILHIGSLSLTTMPSRKACYAAVKYARDRGVVISYDPNYRAALWRSRDEALEMMKSLLPLTDILKVSDEEMTMLTGTEDPAKGSAALSEYGIDLVMVTLGADGVFARCGDNCVRVRGENVRVADTNGAGDTFVGAMLAQLASREFVSLGKIGELQPEELTRMVSFANRAAAITCSRHGAIPAMPYATELI